MLVTTAKVNIMYYMTGSLSMPARVYDEGMTGPTLLMNPGNTLCIMLQNDLSLNTVSELMVTKGITYNLSPSLTTTNVRICMLMGIPEDPYDNILYSIPGGTLHAFSYP